ncbi:MAG: hypothetical protein IJ769_02225 [Clostridia bacterium]|nr:hypothetical protein [Clostridia bacterium]
MKRFRPHCAGFIVLYALTFLSFADVVYTLYRQAKGITDDYMANFSIFSYFVFALAMGYVWMYARSQVLIDDERVRIAFPANIRPKQGEKRTIFVFRQGDTDIKFIDKTIRLDAITRYGYVEDLGYERIDASQVGEKNKLFPVHEVAFITNENKRYHMNAGIYSPKQLKAIFELIQQRSGVAPEGKLREMLK